MKACRENLNKLRDLCNDLSDRDDQLKINASTLWEILEGVHDTREILVGLETEDSINIAIEKLSIILTLVTDRGCRKVVSNE